MRPVQAAGPAKQATEPDLAVEVAAEQASGRLTPRKQTGPVVLQCDRPPPGPQSGRRAKDTPCNRAAKRQETVRQAVTDRQRTAGAAGPKAERNCCAGPGQASIATIGPWRTTRCPKPKGHSNVAAQTSPRGQPIRHPHRLAAAQGDQHREPQQKASSNWGESQPAFGRGIEQHRRQKVARASAGQPPALLFRQQAYHQQGQQQRAEHEQERRRWPQLTPTHWRGVGPWCAPPKGRCAGPRRSLATQAGHRWTARPPDQIKGRTRAAAGGPSGSKPRGTQPPGINRNEKRNRTGLLASAAGRPNPARCAECAIAAD